MRLFQFPYSPNCQKVVAFVYELGLPVEIVELDAFKGQARTPEMLKLNPNGKVPVLQDGDFVLWESNAILGYLAAKADRSDLAPSAPRERADVDRWLAFHNAHFGAALGKVGFERIAKKLGGLGAPDEAVVAAGARDFQTHAGVIETTLHDRDYLTGRLTIADFALTPYAAVAELVGLDTSSLPRFRAWVARMSARPSFSRVFAELRERSAVYQPKVIAQ
jgi:glutathione S-transferase